jgi:predicted DsbA family dithiol-disulfide isomerase
VRIDVWSDVQCPWCYIGKRRFEQAVATTGIDVDVTYHSFELAPDTPVDYTGTPSQYLAERKGLPLPQVDQMIEQVTQIAASVGLDYDYAHMHQTNTRKAHELLHYARAHGRQAETKEALLRAYFIDGGHVGRTADLVDLAVTLGFDRDDVAAALDAGTYAAAVQADVDQAAALGIHGVPFYVVDGRYGVSGAQEPSLFAQVLRQVIAERSSAEGTDTTASADDGEDVA